MTTLLLTLGIFTVAMALLGITWLLTGRNNVRATCSVELNGEPQACELCPNKPLETEDHYTALAKTTYPGRRDPITIDVYEGRASQHNR